MSHIKYKGAFASTVYPVHTERGNSVVSTSLQHRSNVILMFSVCWVYSDIRRTFGSIQASSSETVGAFIRLYGCVGECEQDTLD